MKRITTIAVLSVLMFGHAYSQTKQKKEVMNNTERTDHYTFQLSDKVTRKEVTFKNRYGITLLVIYIRQKISVIKNLQPSY